MPSTSSQNMSRRQRLKRKGTLLNYNDNISNMSDSIETTTMTTMKPIHQKVLMPSTSSQNMSRRQRLKRKGTQPNYKDDSDLDTVSPPLSKKRNHSNSTLTYKQRLRATTLVAKNYSEESNNISNLSDSFETTTMTTMKPRHQKVLMASTSSQSTYRRKRLKRKGTLLNYNDNISNMSDSIETTTMTTMKPIHQKVLMPSTSSQNMSRRQRLKRKGTLLNYNDNISNMSDSIETTTMTTMKPIHQKVLMLSTSSQRTSRRQRLKRKGTQPNYNDNISTMSDSFETKTMTTMKPRHQKVLMLSTSSQRTSRRQRLKRKGTQPNYNDNISNMSDSIETTTMTTMKPRHQKVLMLSTSSQRTSRRQRLKRKGTQPNYNDNISTMSDSFETKTMTTMKPRHQKVLMLSTSSQRTSRRQRLKRKGTQPSYNDNISNMSDSIETTTMTTMKPRHQKVLMPSTSSQNMSRRQRLKRKGTLLNYNDNISNMSDSIETTTMTTMKPRHQKVLMPSTSSQNMSRRQRLKRKGTQPNYKDDSDLDTLSPPLSEIQTNITSPNKHRIPASTFLLGNYCQKSHYLNYADCIAVNEELRKKGIIISAKKELLQDYKEKSDINKPSTSKNVVEEFSETRGFDRGLQPERVIYATTINDELMLLMTWKGCDEADLVPSRQANMLCPQLVIQYYQESISFREEEEEADN